MLKCNEKGKCPVCGIEDLNYGTLEVDDIGVIYPWNCNECGAVGEETYELDFTGHYSIIKANGENISCANDEEME